MGEGDRLAVVWGASGFVGRHLVAALAAQGWRVRALVRDAGSAGDIPEGVERCTLHTSARFAQMLPLLEGADVVYHCASHGDTSPRSFRDFIRGTGRFARAAREAGVPRYIQLSTVAVYGRNARGRVGPGVPPAPDGAYAASRAAAERAANRVFSRCPERAILVRIPMVVGAAMTSHALRHFFGTLRSGFFLHPGDRTSVLNCVGIRRLVAGLTHLASPAPGLPRVVQLGDNIRWEDLATLYAQATGRRVVRVQVPEWMSRLLGAVPDPDGGIPTGLSVLANRVEFEDTLSGPSMPATTEEDLRELIDRLARARRGQGTHVLPLTALNLFGRAAAGLLPLVVAWRFGANAVTDALFWVFSAVLFLGGAFSSALEAAVVPWASRHLAHGNREDWAGGPLLSLVSLGIASTALFMVGNHALLDAGWLLSGRARELASAYMGQAGLAIVFMLLAGMWSGIAMARSHFVLPGAALAAKWWTTLALVLILADFQQAAWLGLAFLGGEIVRSALLLAQAPGRLRLPPGLAQWRRELSGFPWQAFAFTFLSFAALHVNQMVDRLMASWLGPGSVSLLEYAWTLSLVPTMIFGSGYLIIWYSRISADHAARLYDDLGEKVRQMRRDVVRFSVTSCVILWVLAGSLLWLGRGLGGLSGAEVREICGLVLLFSFSLPFLLLNTCYARLLTVLDRPQVALAIFGAKIVVNVAGNVFLLPLGIAGIVGSTVIAEMLSLAAFAFTSRAAMRDRGMRE